MAQPIPVLHITQWRNEQTHLQFDRSGMVMLWNRRPFYFQTNFFPCSIIKRWDEHENIYVPFQESSYDPRHRYHFDLTLSPNAIERDFTCFRELEEQFVPDATKSCIRSQNWYKRWRCGISPNDIFVFNTQQERKHIRDVKEGMYICVLFQILKYDMPDKNAKGLHCKTKQILFEPEVDWEGSMFAFRFAENPTHNPPIEEQAETISDSE